MKKYFLSFLFNLAFLASGNAGADSPTELKDYFFIQNDHSQVMADWVGQEEASLHVTVQSLSAYFKKSAESKSNDSSLQDQILLSASALQSWFLGVAKSLHPNLNANTEISFFPKEDAKHFRSNAEISLEKIKAQLRKRNEYQSYSDNALTDAAVQKMPAGFDSQVSNVDEFILSNPWPSSQIQVLAGDVVLVSVKDRLHVTTTVVLTLPPLAKNLETNLKGYASLDRLTIPSSFDGHRPVYAILNLDFVTSGQGPLSYANLKVDFATDIKVTSGSKLNPNDHRMIVFSPIRSGAGFESSSLSENYVPTERLPYLRAQNILPKGKLWKPLERALGPEGIFDFGFVNLYGVELDLIHLQARSLYGRIEFFNRQTANNQNSSGDGERGGCVSVHDQDHCLNWRIMPGDYLEQYLLNLTNKYLDSKKQIIRAKMKQKYGEFAAIVSGSYGAYQVRRDSNGSYSKFSENMLKDLCQDGTLDSSDEQCRSLNSESER